MEPRKEIRSSTASIIEIINSARLGTKDYDFDSVQIIKEGKRSIVYSIKSKIDGKRYAAKRLDYTIGSMFNSEEMTNIAKREIGSIKVLDHPMIMGIVDIVKDRHNILYIIME
jgi:serine/threonine protein kinase